jgi:hypothetical protein
LTESGAWDCSSGFRPADRRDHLDLPRQDRLTQPKVEVDQETAGSLAALALRITRATGIYRGTGSASIPIITFGPVTLTGESGDVSTFEIDIG